MPTLDQWQYLALPKRGLVISGILANDTRHQLVNGQRIYTNTVISVGIRGDSPVAVTKSGTAYRLLDPAPTPDNQIERRPRAGGCDRR